MPHRAPDSVGRPFRDCLRDAAARLAAAQADGHYAENDDRVNAGWPAFDAALKANNVPHEMFKYPGTQHGFNNDTTPRYDAAAAKLSLSDLKSLLSA